MQIRAHTSVNLWTAVTVAYPFGLVHVEKDTNCTVPDDVVDYAGYDLLVQGGDIVVLEPPAGGGGDTGAPTGTPTETGLLSQPMNDTDNDIVALQDAATTVLAGDPLQIGTEYMTVIDAADLSNLKVTRGSFGSTFTAHSVADPVSIWGTATPAVLSASASKKKR